MSVHHSSSGYETGARAYVKGRPSYPAEAAVWLREVLGVGPGRKVLEVGAGTGKFIAVLKQCGGEITAVEPVAGMREQLVPAFPDVTVLAGNAESIPLPDGSVDAVVCAQAFHWFATAAALQEMRRVLKPGGRLGLIWNVRDERTPWVAALTAITDPREGDTPRYRTGDWRRVFPRRASRPSTSAMSRMPMSAARTTSSSSGRCRSASLRRCRPNSRRRSSATPAH